MGKKKKNSKKGGSRFFRWIRSDLPDEEESKSPVLLLGVTKISDSPSLSRRRHSEISQHSCGGSGRFYRPPKSKYTRGLQADARLEKIRQDLLTHKNNHQESYIPEVHSKYLQESSKGDGKRKSKQNCLILNCVGACKDCERDRSIRSSNRGSFLFHRPENRQSSLCPSEPYEPSSVRAISPQQYEDRDIEHKYSEHIPTSHVASEHNSDSPRRSNTNSFYSITPKSTERRSLLLSNLNERFRKTLSLDSRKVETNRVPLSLPQTRPKSLVQTDVSPKSYRSDDTFLEPQQQAIQPKKKRFRPKSFFSLETFFDSKRSDSSSVDDYSSSKYKKFELESDESPVFRDRLDLSNRRRIRDKEQTPDLLDLPFIIDSVRKGQSGSRQIKNTDSHYYRNLGRTVVDAVPKDATDSSAQGASNAQYLDDDDVEYIEPIRSNFTSQSTLIIDIKTNCERPLTPLKPDSVLSIETDETDIRIPSSNLTISPKSNRLYDIDSIGPYEIEVKESDLLIRRAKDLIVKIMDKSVDSIGSCSLDVDASTDFSDTTSGSLNLLTPSSTASRVRDFTSRLHERTASAHAPHHNAHLLAQASHNPSPNPPRTGDNLLRPHPKVLLNDSSSITSHRSRSKKIEHKKPSYLNLACSVNGYSNLTTYDSKLRQNINKSREASPIRPITHAYYRGEVNQSLLVPVPVSADKLLVPTFQPHDTKRSQHLTDRAPTKAHTDPYLATSPILVYMAAENRQLKSNFLGKNMAAASTTPYDGQKYSVSMLHQSKTNDEVDNIAREITFKSSYSETNITSKKSSGSSLNGMSEYTSESYTIHSTNGVSKHVEITKENGEKLTSPMKSFIQQRVERLYGPGALAQGFFKQKRHKNKSQSEAEETINEATKVLTEKSLNCIAGEQQYSYTRLSNKSDRNNENIEMSPGAKSPALPVLRHLRPEFRAQLPILSPKKSPGRTDTVAPSVNGSPCAPKKPEVKNESGASAVIDSLTEDMDSVRVSEKTNGENGTAVAVNGACSDARDAHYFIDLEKRETDRLIQLAISAEKELESLQSTDTSEEVLGLLRSAAGKARLLATQKMQQFEGLCYNNINERAGEQFPTTIEDLQGFWDMVCLQVRNVDQLFVQLSRIRANGWKETEQMSSTSSPRTAPRAPRPAAAPAAPKNEKARLAAERREADRKAMMEHRRRMVREKQMAAKSCTPGTSREDQRVMAIEGSKEVEIFVGGAAKKVLPQGDHASAADSQTSVASS